MTDSRKKHWGWHFALFYLLWAIFAMISAYNCNGPQLELYHGKCGPFLVLLSPITAFLSFLLDPFDPTIFDTKTLSVINVYLRNLLAISINLAFYYFVGQFMTVKLLEEKYWDMTVKFVLSGFIVLGITWLSMILLLFLK